MNIGTKVTLYGVYDNWKAKGTFNGEVQKFGITWIELVNEFGTFLYNVAHIFAVEVMND